MRHSRRLAVISLLITTFIVAGCAGIQRAVSQKDSTNSAWQGRLSVRTEPDLAVGQLQAQIVSAAFELKGDSRQGELLLLTPLGTTAAFIQWSANGAQLQAQGSTRQFGDLQQLVLQLLGSSVPVTALFMWLHGEAIAVDGWQVDQSQFNNGKITARRDSPAPRAELHLILTQ